MRRYLDELDRVGIDAVGEDAANAATGVIDGNPPGRALEQLGFAQLGSAHSPAKATSLNRLWRGYWDGGRFDIGCHFGVTREMAGARTSETF